MRTTSGTTKHKMGRVCSVSFWEPYKIAIFRINGRVDKLWVEE